MKNCGVRLMEKAVFVKCASDAVSAHCVDLAADEFNAILKASFGGTLTLKERQALGFVIY